MHRSSSARLRCMNILTGFQQMLQLRSWRSSISCNQIGKLFADSERRLVFSTSEVSDDDQWDLWCLTFNTTQEDLNIGYRCTLVERMMVLAIHYIIHSWLTATLLLALNLPSWVRRWDYEKTLPAIRPAACLLSVSWGFYQVSVWQWPCPSWACELQV